MGIELAQIFRGLGGEATVVEGNDHLRSRETPRVGELVKELLEADGIGVHTGKHVESVRRDGDEKVVKLDDGAELRAQEFIVAVDRSRARRSWGSTRSAWSSASAARCRSTSTAA